MDISIALSGEHLCSCHFLTINKESTLHSHLLSRMTINRVAIYIIPNHPGATILTFLIHRYRQRLRLLYQQLILMQSKS